MGVTVRADLDVTGVRVSLPLPPPAITNVPPESAGRPSSSGPDGGSQEGEKRGAGTSWTAWGGSYPVGRPTQEEALSATRSVFGNLVWNTPANVAATPERARREPQGTCERDRDVPGLWAQPPQPGLQLPGRGSQVGVPCCSEDREEAVTAQQRVLPARSTSESPGPRGQPGGR